MSLSLERGNWWTKPCLAKTWRHWLFEWHVLTVCVGVSIKRRLPNRETDAILAGTQWELEGVSEMVEKAVEQHRAKRQTFDILKIQGLPVPPALAEEFDGTER